MNVNSLETIIVINRLLPAPSNNWNFTVIFLTHAGLESYRRNWLFFCYRLQVDRATGCSQNGNVRQSTGNIVVTKAIWRCRRFCVLIVGYWIFRKEIKFKLMWWWKYCTLVVSCAGGAPSCGVRHANRHHGQSRNIKYSTFRDPEE